MKIKLFSLLICILFAEMQAATDDPSGWWKVSEDGKRVIYNGPPPPPEPTMGKMVKSIVPGSANFNTGKISLNIVTVLISGSTHLQFAPRVEVANLQTFWNGVTEEKVLGVTKGQKFQDPIVQPAGARGMPSITSLIPTYTYLCPVTRVQETPYKAHIIWNGNVVNNNGSPFELSYSRQIDRSYTASVKERDLAKYFYSDGRWLGHAVPQ